MSEKMQGVQGPPEPISCATPTTNACKLCTPLGACLAFRGIEGCVPFLHGSQGCATYIRRYLISHFREPMDIASSSFSEETVVFGGKRNLAEGLLNVIRQYDPAMIGIATTCLAETIGDDVGLFLSEFRKAYGKDMTLPALVEVSTPSYAGSHVDGFWGAVRSLVQTMSKRVNPDADLLAVCPGMVSAADLREIKAMLHAFHVRHILFPDYSETLDGGSWEEYQKMPPGGTPIRAIERIGDAGAILNFSVCQPPDMLPGAGRLEKEGLRLLGMPLPVGVAATDRFFDLLSDWAGLSVPHEFKRQRARLVDAYVDGHKITAGRKVAVFGDADFVVSMTAFLGEIGLKPVVCAAGGKTPGFAAKLRAWCPDLPADASVADGIDYTDIEGLVRERGVELLVGSSKAYSMSRRLGLPLFRAGFPVHDRVDGARLLSCGYTGAQNLFDRICNLLLETRQEQSPIGYSYM